MSLLLRGSEHTVTLCSNGSEQFERAIEERAIRSAEHVPQPGLSFLISQLTTPPGTHNNSTLLTTFEQLNLMTSRNSAYFTAGVVTTLTVLLLNRWLSHRAIGKTTNGRKRVLFFGDSITQHGFNPSDGWISNLAYWWSRRVDVLNRGFSGYNTRWGLNIVQEVVIDESPDFVFIFFGANDAVDQSVVQHVPVEEYSENLQEIVRKIKKVNQLTELIV